MSDELQPEKSKDSILNDDPSTIMFENMIKILTRRQANKIILALLVTRYCYEQ